MPALLKSAAASHWNALKRAVLEEKQDRRMKVLNGRLIYQEGDRLFVRIPRNDGRI